MNGNEDMTETVYLHLIRDTLVSIKTYPYFLFDNSVRCSHRFCYLRMIAFRHYIISVS